MILELDKKVQKPFYSAERVKFCMISARRRYASEQPGEARLLASRRRRSVLLHDARVRSTRNS